MVQLFEPSLAIQEARDRYRALINHADMMISGLKNKVNVAVNNLTPDDLAADRMKENQKPANS